MECLLHGERLIETLAWRESSAMAPDQRARALEGCEIRADGDRGSGEPSRQRHHRDPPALLQQVTDPPPTLLYEQSFLHRIFRGAQVGVRFTAGIGVVHGSFDRAPCVKVHKALPCSQIGPLRLSRAYDKTVCTFDAITCYAFIDVYVRFRNNK